MQGKKIQWNRNLIQLKTEAERICLFSNNRYQRTKGNFQSFPPDCCLHAFVGGVLVYFTPAAVIAISFESAANRLTGSFSLIAGMMTERNRPVISIWEIRSFPGGEPDFVTGGSGYEKKQKSRGRQNRCGKERK